MEYRFSKNSNININNHNTNSVSIFSSDINLRSLSEKKPKPNPRSSFVNDITVEPKADIISESIITNNRFAENLKVEVIDAANFQRAARTLQIAFANDDFTKYLTNTIESPILREQVDLALFEASVFSSILDGLVVAIRDEEAELTDSNAPFLAVACFTRPNMDSGFWDRVHSGNFKKELIANESCSQRVFNEQFPILEETKSYILQDEEEKAWYLGDLGTTPNARGKGCAKKLLNFVYENYIDVEEGSLCYLESTHPRNRAIYEKLGFTFVEKLKVGHVNCSCDAACDLKPLDLDIMVRGANGQKWMRKQPSEKGNPMEEMLKM